MARPEGTTVIKRTYSPRELRGLMEHLHMAVGMRLHFLIFAASARVPVAPLPYASKVTAFLQSIGMGRNDVALSAHTGSLLARIDRLWDLRDEHLAMVGERLPELREAAASTARLAAGLLHDRAPAAAT